MPACPHCKAPVESSAQICPSCGSTLSLAIPGLRPTALLHVVRADGNAEKAITLEGEMLTCGSQGALLLADDPFVGPQEAQFIWHHDQLFIEDLGSSNGLYWRLRDEQPLGSGSELRIGRQRLVLESIAPPAAGTDGAFAWGSPDAGYRYRLIRLLEGGLRGDAYPLPDGDYELGRESGHITFADDGFISSRHALLRIFGAQATIRDLGSSNGTFIRLSSRSPVSHDDEFLIGRELIRVELRAQP